MIRQNNPDFCIVTEMPCAVCSKLLTFPWNELRLESFFRPTRGCQSCRMTLSSELWTSRPPLYSMTPSLRNRFMKKLTLDRVVPTMSARVSWLTFGTTGSGLPSFPKLASREKHARQPLLTGIEELIHQVLLDPNVAGEQIAEEQFRKSGLVVKHTNHAGLLEPHDGGLRHGGCACHAHRLTGQASFAKEIAGPQNGDDG